MVSICAWGVHDSLSLPSAYILFSFIVCPLMEFKVNLDIICVDFESNHTKR